MTQAGAPDPGAVTGGTTPPDGRPVDEQPRWRRDFPIDWPEDEYISRKDLVKFIVLTSFAFVVGQFWIVVKSLTDRPAAFRGTRIAGVDDLAVGGAMTFQYPAGSTPRLLVRTGEQEFVAYDQQCTHLLCPVVPAVESGRLHCPCHNGWFDLETGRALSGPPRRPLPRVTLEIRDGAVYATGVDLGAA